MYYRTYMNSLGNTFKISAEFSAASPQKKKDNINFMEGHPDLTEELRELPKPTTVRKVLAIQNRFQQHHFLGPSSPEP